MYPRQRQATLQNEGRSTYSTNSKNSTWSHNQTCNLGRGPPSAPAARLSKWPKNVYFASDFIASKAAAAAAVPGVKRSRGRRRRAPSTSKTSCLSTDTRWEEEYEPRTHDVVANDSMTSAGKISGFQESQRMKDGNTNPVTADNREGERFLEESASTLLLLHTRFFGGMRREEDIVCRLCIMCREAGWMANPRRDCPDLDPIVLDNMVVAQTRGLHQDSTGWRTNNACPRRDLPPSDEGFSFEDFYEILSQVANLVYPAQERAMYRLLMEGVLPLANDSEPRRWSPRPELLYGRPTLAALRMQRDALRTLFRTYSNTARARTGSSGINRSLFLKMLTDLGFTPESLPGQKAEVIFDDVVRNGLPDTGPITNLSLQQSRRGSLHGARDGNGHFMTTGGPEEVHREDRLCWSLFLEAMAALAVWAVNDRYGRTIQGNRVTDPNSWDSAEDRCGTRHRHDVDKQELLPRYDRSSSRRRVSRKSGELSCRSEECHDMKSRRSRDGHVPSRKETRAQRVASADEDGAAPTLSKGDQQPTYARDNHYDSRRNLMPALPETGHVYRQAEPPLRFRPEPSSSQYDNARVKPSMPQTRASQAALHLWAMPVELRNDEAESLETCGVDNEKGDRVAPGEQEEDKGTDHCLIGYQPEANMAIRAPSHQVQTSLLVGHTVSEEHAPPDADLGRVRDVSDKEGRTADRVAPSDGYSQVTSVVHATFENNHDGSHETPRSKLDSVRPERTIAHPVPKSSERIHTVTPVGSGVQPAADTTRHSMSFSPSAKEASRGSMGVDEHREEDRQIQRGIKAADNAVANASPVTAPRDSSVCKRIDRKDADALSIAPWHGGLPPAIPASEPPAEDSESSHVQTTHPALFDSGLLPAKPHPRPQVQFTNGRVDPRLVPCESGSCIGSTEPESGTSVHGCLSRPSTVGHGDLFGTRESCKKASEVVSGLASGTAHVKMGVEAASCTTALYEELLDPRIACVYSRHRKELQAIFERYRTRPDGERLPVSLHQDNSGGICGLGIRRFVNDFPALRRWAQDDHSNALRLIVRASCGRGWQCNGEEGSEGLSSRLSYFGFLEVLTRMAYATQGQRPLHHKLMDLIRALETNGPYRLSTCTG